MRNNLAIAVSVTALFFAVVGLAATLVVVWPDADAPAEATAPRFHAAEIGQTKSNTPNYVGPEQPSEDDAEQVKREKPKKKPNPTLRPPTRVPKKPTPKRVKQYKPAVLQIVTNFDEADVTVNGLAYPEYYEPGAPEGMVLPAGGPYFIEVKFGSNTKTYNLNLRPHETRLLLVELSGYKSGAPPPPKKKPVAKKKEEKKEEKKDDDDKKSGGKITVYSKPAGTVIVDGKETGEKTPGSVDLENGRHEVQVKYESGSISEKKIVRVRNGSRIKLFFRERKN